MEPDFLNKQPKRMRPDTEYDACLVFQKGADSHSRLMQKLIDQGYPALLYAITKRKDEIAFRMRWTPTQTFWKESGLPRMVSLQGGPAPSTLTSKRLTREKASLRNKKTLSCKCDQFYEDTFSLPVSLAATFLTGPHQVCRFSFVVCPDVHQLLFFTFQWMGHLVVDDICYFLHALCLLFGLPVDVLVALGVTQIQVCHCLCLL